MADKKISQFTAIALPGIDVANDVVPIVDATGPETKKATVSALVGSALVAGIDNLQVTNIKAKDGTVSMVLGNTTGNVGIGGNSAAGIKLTIGGTLSVSSNTAIGSYIGGTIPSTATTGYVGFTSQPVTQAASFTVTNMEHFLARPQTFGAGSAVTNQYGFRASSLLTGATNNFGFRSDINAGANRWNFYTGGTADNYFAGSVGIGAFPNAQDKLNVSGTLPTSSNTSLAVVTRGVIPSGSTTQGVGFTSNLATEVASFTLGTMSHFRAAQGTIGAGSTVTNQYGFEALNTLTGATNNYGFYSNIAAGSGRWNFYANGTADNYFAGNVGIGGNLDFSSTAQRITGDMSNATVANRLYLQNSVTNGNTSVSAIPNGTSVVSGFIAFNNSDPTNAAFAQLATSAGTEVRLASAITGTGTYLPMTFYTGGSERVRIDTSGNVIVNTAAIATTATDGFLYVPTCAGAPTGTPTSYAGRAPIVVDTTNNKLYFYSNGTWRDAGP